MMRRLAAVTQWLLLGHGVLFALYWGLLNVPESNVAMLAVSAVLATAIVVGAAAVQADAVRHLGTDASWRPRWRWRRVIAPVPAFIVGVAIWLAFAWLRRRLGAVHASRSGEIDAWLIAQFDWTRTAWLHRAIALALDFLRDVIGLSLAVGAFVAGTIGTFAEVLRAGWVRQAFGWRRLLLITAAVVGLIWLPWQAATWRPASLPAGLAEPIVAAAKLAIIAAIAHFGWTLILWSATPPRGSGPAPS